MPARIPRIAPPLAAMALIVIAAAAMADEAHPRLERFEHFVLEGDITRGMPGYRSQNLVVSELDAMYAFLRGKAEAAGPATPAASIIPPGR